MYRISHILFVLTALLIFSGTLSAQDRKVCVNTKEMYKATGLDNSTYEFGLHENGGIVGGKLTEIEGVSDSIIVEWGKNKGIFQLGVREISEHGCYGDWAFLDVEVVGQYAEFSRNRYSLCGNDSVFIEYNKEDFQASSWVDPALNTNGGYIKKTGTYELITIDYNGCRLSNYIQVMNSPQPAVKLGADTVICTTDFKLYALNTQNNPTETAYTWSTGETGASLAVQSHDLNRDIMYWIRADLGDCSANDTIVVLACREILSIPNTFTPNGDGDNDEWMITALRDYPNCVVEVFDRWGRKVFTSNKGYTDPWNGRDTRGHYMPMETYYYIINLNDNRHSKPILGTITIIR